MAGNDDEQERLLRKAAKEKVLASKFSALPLTKFIEAIHTERGVKLIIPFAEEYGFPNETIQDMKDGQAGGGEPHVNFIHLVQSKHFKTSVVKEAMVNAGINRTKIEDAFKNLACNSFFDDLLPKYILPLHSLLREDAQTKKPCWKNVANKLGMSEDIASIAAGKAQGGVYCIGETFCAIIKGGNPTIQKFHDDATRILGKMPFSNSILDGLNAAIEEAIDVEITMEMHKKTEDTRQLEDALKRGDLK